jgi:hypothetical protein
MLSSTPTDRWRGMCSESSWHDMFIHRLRGYLNEVLSCTAQCLSAGGMIGLSRLYSASFVLRAKEILETSWDLLSQSKPGNKASRRGQMAPAGEVLVSRQDVWWDERFGGLADRKVRSNRPPTPTETLLNQQSCRTISDCSLYRQCRSQTMSLQIAAATRDRKPALQEIAGTVTDSVTIAGT